jgi:hypothetical protein
MWVWCIVERSCCKLWIVLFRCKPRPVGYEENRRIGVDERIQLILEYDHHATDPSEQLSVDGGEFKSSLLGRNGYVLIARIPGQTQHPALQLLTVSIKRSGTLASFSDALVAVGGVVTIERTNKLDGVVLDAKDKSQPYRFVSRTVRLPGPSLEEETVIRNFGEYYLLPVDDRKSDLQPASRPFRPAFICEAVAGRRRYGYVYPMDTLFNYHKTAEQHHIARIAESIGTTGIPRDVIAFVVAYLLIPNIGSIIEKAEIEYRSAMSDREQ